MADALFTFPIYNEGRNLQNSFTLYFLTSITANPSAIESLAPSSDFLQGTGWPFAIAVCQEGHRSDSTP